MPTVVSQATCCTCGLHMPLATPGSGPWQHKGQDLCQAEGCTSLMLHPCITPSGGGTGTLSMRGSLEVACGEHEGLT